MYLTFMQYCTFILLTFIVLIFFQNSTYYKFNGGLHGFKMLLKGGLDFFYFHVKYKGLLFGV